jgi:hypothetical protein
MERKDAIKKVAERYGIRIIYLFGSQKDQGMDYLND